MTGCNTGRRDAFVRRLGLTRVLITAALMTSLVIASGSALTAAQVPATPTPSAPPYLYHTQSALDQVKAAADDPVILKLGTDELRSGDRVILNASTAVLKFGDTVLATAEDQVVFRLILVETYQGNLYCLLESDMVTGWALPSSILSFENSLSSLTTLIQSDPQQAWGYMARGSVRLAEGDMELAVLDLDTAIQLDRNRSLQYTDYGRIQFLRRENQLALGEFTESLRWQTKGNQVLGRSLINRAAVRARRLEYDLALADLDGAISILQNEINSLTFRNVQIGSGFNRVYRNLDEANLVRGDVQLALGLPELAEKDYKQIKTGAALAAADTSRGDYLTTQKKYPEALKKYDAAIKNEQLFVAAYLGKARLLEINAWNDASTGQPPRPEKYLAIIEMLQKAVDRSPGESGCRKLLGAAPGSVEARVVAATIAAYCRIAWYQATCPHENGRDSVKAVENARVAVGLTLDQDPDALNSLAAAYARVQSFDAAIRAQTKALKLLPADSALVDAYRSRLSRYQGKRTFQETSPSARVRS